MAGKKSGKISFPVKLLSTKPTYKIPKIENFRNYDDHYARHENDDACIFKKLADESKWIGYWLAAGRHAHVCLDEKQKQMELHESWSFFYPTELAKPEQQFSAGRQTI
ncbi:MAG: hypothetical protein QM734_03850 [Cyclobacteriaceae bacterium]